MAEKRLTPPTPYTPPEPTIDPCPRCGAAVITRVWVMANGKQPPYWRTLDGPVSPVFGSPHQCPQKEHVA